MSRYAMLFAALLTLSAFPAAFWAQTITMNRPRPLGALAAELNDRYAYLVTYEEAPFDASELREEPRPNGRRFIFPAWKPIDFQLPDALAGAGRATPGSAEHPNPIPPLGPDILDPLVEQYNESGNPGTFSVIYEGDYAHIVQVVRRVDGRPQTFEPILSTKVEFTPEARRCSETLNELLRQVSKARGTSIVNVNMGPGNSWSRDCSLTGQNLPAREALRQILDQVGTTPIPGDSRARYAWFLMYDANWREYFLEVSIVSYVRPHRTKSPPLVTGRGVPSGTPSTRTGHKGAEPTPVKKD